MYVCSSEFVIFASFFDENQNISSIKAFTVLVKGGLCSIWVETQNIRLIT